jgi:NitT/TauT family transport system substrate-binding protein
MAAQVAIYAPYLIPIEKGYYAEEGLELDVRIASGGISTPALLSGTLDITTSNPSVLSPALRGAPVKIVYTMANRSQYQLWSTSKDLKSLEDLKGRRVGIMARGDSLEISMKLALLKAGLPLDWVSFTALGPDSALTAALVAGSLPAVILPDTNAEVARRTGALDKGHLVYDMHKDLPLPYSGIAVTDKFLQTRADTLRGFLRATMKGVRYMKTYKAETIAIVEKYSKQTDRRISEFDYDGAVSTLTDDGSVADDLLRADLMVRASLLEIPASQIPPLERIYDYTIVRAANAELDRLGWTPQP